jgi:hypothetical protein
MVELVGKHCVLHSRAGISKRVVSRCACLGVLSYAVCLVVIAAVVQSGTAVLAELNSRLLPLGPIAFCLAAGCVGKQRINSVTHLRPELPA